MDVSLSGRRIFYVALALACASLSSCGNRYDLSTAAGQQSRIDDANAYLSSGDCANADNAITPLYNSQYVTDQIRIIKASAQACFAHFKLLTFAANLVGGSSALQSMVKSLDNTAGDAARNWMYAAVDVLTGSGASLQAGQRGTSVNDYMIFLQFGVISAILRNYGNPDTSGNKQTTYSYPGTMSDIDGCALAAAFSFIVDSFSQSNLNDSSTKTIVTSFDSVCKSVLPGAASCSSINRDRTLCSTNATAKNQASLVVSGVNSSW